jgi:exodeoxyribonuclease-3
MSAPPESLGILTLNIGSPSAKRAERQLEWLSDRGEDVFVLTETRPTAGSDLIGTRLANAGWQVYQKRPAGSERGVLVASRIPSRPARWSGVDYLEARAEAIDLGSAHFDIIGVYVPSRDDTPLSVARKQRFAVELQAALRARAPRRAVLLGDLNVLEPDHHPHHKVFRDWEYGLYSGLIAKGWIDAYRLMRTGSIEHSWVSPDDRGFRFDHVFVTGDLRESVRSCTMLHETREQGLTDHSALTISLACERLARLEVDESVSGTPMVLF